MSGETIIEYRTTWNNELFFKHRGTCRLARRLIRKSVLISKCFHKSKNIRSFSFFSDQTRIYRQLQYTENDLAKELRKVLRDRDLLHGYCQSTSLSDGLQKVSEKAKVHSVHSVGFVISD